MRMQASKCKIVLDLRKDAPEVPNFSHYYVPNGPDPLNPGVPAYKSSDAVHILFM